MSATLITNARIFDGVSVITESGHVLVESGRISRVSLEESLSAPEGCTIVDATGCTLLPGLIDAHMHVYRDVGLLETAIKYGVTTVLDMHNEPDWFKEIHKVTSQRNDVSDVKSCGFGATIKDGWPAAIVKLVSQEPNVCISMSILSIMSRLTSFRSRRELPSGRTSPTRTRYRNSSPETKLPVPGMIQNTLY